MNAEGSQNAHYNVFPEENEMPEDKMECQSVLKFAKRIDLPEQFCHSKVKKRPQRYNAHIQLNTPNNIQRHSLQGTILPAWNQWRQL